LQILIVGGYVNDAEAAVKRSWKVGLRVLALTVALLVIAWLGLKGALSSSYARQQAASQLSETLGVPVVVDEFDPGVTSTSATIRIPDTSAETPSDLLKIGSLETDVTLGGLITGSVSPTVVATKDVEMRLRLDEAGKILSALPKPKGGGEGPVNLPTITLATTRIRIAQAGRPEFELAGVEGKLARDGDGYAITGSVDDPKWGKWKVAGRLAADPADGYVELTSDRATLSDPQLRSIPFVPPEVWANVTASGETAALVKFTFKPGADLNYLVELRPHGAALTVPPADVTVTQVHGLIRVGDGKVQVTDGKVSLADGTVAVAGVYDFAKPTSVIGIKMDAKGVDVRKLPAEWGLPKEFEGKLRGTAELTVLIQPEGRVEPRGQGFGQLDDAKFLGLPAEVKMRLVPKGGRYRFDVTQEK
jgi:hypothetical protein